MNSMYGGIGASLRGPTGAGGQMNPTGFYREKIPKGYRAGQLQQFSPEQMQLFQQLFGHVGPQSYLSRLAGGDEEIFKQIEGPALRQFGELQGNIASRFSGMGLGGRHSSGFQNTMNQAASNFAQDLASRRQSLQQDAIRDLMTISHSLLGERPVERSLIKKEHRPSFLQSLLGAGSTAVGAGIGGYFGGMPGAKLGAQIGGGFGQGFLA